MRNTARQGGSTAIFVIFGVVLVVLALGSLYGVRRFAMNDQTPPMVVPQETESSDSSLDDTLGDESDSDEDATDEVSGNNSNELPSTTEEEEVTNGEEDTIDEDPTTNDTTSTDDQVAVAPPTTGGTGSTGLPSTGGGSTAVPASPETLPQSGAEDVILPLLAVTFISASGIAYVKSRLSLQG